jgi:V-type H+-transporting ATPase subunit G
MAASHRGSSSCCRLRSGPQRRCPRLRQAEGEAQAEIEQDCLPAQGESSRPRNLRHCHGSYSTEVDKETQVPQTYFWQNRDEVLDNLWAYVCDIWPEIHKNYRIKG